jgi:hypothetical protein
MCLFGKVRLTKLQTRKAEDLPEPGVTLPSDVRDGYSRTGVNTPETMFPKWGVVRLRNDAGGSGSTFG